MQYFSISNMIQSIVAGIITSIIIGIFFFFRSLKLKVINNFHLLANLNNYLLVLYSSKKIENETISPLIENIKEIMLNHKNQKNYDEDSVLHMLNINYNILEAKFEIMYNQILHAMNVSSNINMSYIKHKIRSKMHDIYKSSFTIKMYNINGISINIVEKSKWFLQEISEISKELDDQIAGLQNELVESPDKAHVLSKKISELKEQRNIYIKDRLDDVISESQETLDVINIYTPMRTKVINDLISIIEQIINLFPKRYKKIIEEVKNSVKNYSEYFDDPILKAKIDKKFDDLEDYFGA